jgi:hypothetical protein
MPWWSWLLIWTGLVLGLVGMLAWFGWMLVRKLMTAADALGELGDQIAGLDLDGVAPKTVRFRPAVFKSQDDLFAAWEIRRSLRATHRQSRRDALTARGKLLITAPLTQRTDPDA